MALVVEEKLREKLIDLNIPGAKLGTSFQDVTEDALDRIFLSLFSVYDSSWGQEEGQNKKQTKKHILRYLRLLDVGHLAPSVVSLQPGDPAVVRTLTAIVTKLEDRYPGKLKKRALHVLKTNKRRLEAKGNREAERSSYLTPKKTKIDADHLIQPSQSGHLKLSNGKVLVPGSALRGRELARTPPRGTQPSPRRQVLMAQDRGSPSLQPSQNTSKSPSKSSITHRPRTPSRGTPANDCHNTPKNNERETPKRNINRTPSSQKRVSKSIEKVAQTLNRKCLESPGGRLNVIPTGKQLPRTPASAEIPARTQLIGTPDSADTRAAHILRLSSSQRERNEKKGRDKGREKGLVNQLDFEEDESNEKGKEKEQSKKDKLGKGENFQGKDNMKNIVKDRSKESDISTEIPTNTSGIDNADAEVREHFSAKNGSNTNAIPISKMENKMKHVENNKSVRESTRTPAPEEQAQEAIVKGLEDGVTPVALQCPENLTCTAEDLAFLQRQKAVHDLHALEKKSEALQKQLDGLIFQKGLLEEEYKGVQTEFSMMDQEMKNIHHEVRAALSDVTNESPSHVPLSQQAKLLSHHNQKVTARVAKLERQVEEIERQTMNDTLNNTFCLQSQKDDLAKVNQQLEVDATDLREELKECSERLKEVRASRKRKGGEEGGLSEGQRRIKKRIKVLAETVQIMKERKQKFKEWFS